MAKALLSVKESSSSEENNQISLLLKSLTIKVDLCLKEIGLMKTKHLPQVVKEINQKLDGKENIVNNGSSINEIGLAGKKLRNVLNQRSLFYFYGIRSIYLC